MLVRSNRSQSPQKDELAYWLALNERALSFKLEPFENALQDLPSLDEFWSLRDAELSSYGFDGRMIEALSKIKKTFDLKEYKRQVDSLLSKRVTILTFIDSSYPRRLREMKSKLPPPLLLFAKGDYINFNSCVAVVGSRDCSFHGRSLARRLAKKLADKGYTVVSGLARGVDEEAHCGALESRKGRTIAILPWLDPIYPEEHTQLVQDIERRGARLAEMYAKPFGPLTPSKFVERNRITSGISKFVIAIETDTDGGTIRQAELALDQQKPIFALRPKDNERAKRGFDKLLHDFGAIEFADERDLMKKIQENELQPDSILEEYDQPPQLKLS
jgi:DNA processing protein